MTMTDEALRAELGIANYLPPTPRERHDKLLCEMPAAEFELMLRVLRKACKSLPENSQAREALCTTGLFLKTTRDNHE